MTFLPVLDQFFSRPDDNAGLPSEKIILGLYRELERTGVTIEQASFFTRIAAQNMQMLAESCRHAARDPEDWAIVAHKLAELRRAGIELWVFEDERTSPKSRVGSTH